MKAFTLNKWNKGRFELIKNNLNLKDKKILDIGCNTFIFFDYLKSLGYSGEWVGHDIIKYNDKYPFVFNLDDLKEKFDIITILQLIEHIRLEEFERYLDWINEHLNGYLVIITDNINNIFTHFWEDEHHIRPYSIHSLTSVLRNKGFEIIKEKKFMPLKNPLKILFCKMMNIDITTRLFVVAEKRITRLMLKK